MKVRTASVLMDPWGKPLQAIPAKGGETLVDATLADVCIPALMRQHQEEPGVDMKEALRRSALATEFATKEYVDLDTQDAALLQRLIFWTVSRAFFAPAYALLEAKGDTPAS